jgi:hypothetical protein
MVPSHAGVRPLPEIATDVLLRMGPAAPRIPGENLVSQWQSSLAGVSAPMKFCPRLERAPWVRFIGRKTRNSVGAWR